MIVGVTGSRFPRPAEYVEKLRDQLAAILAIINKGDKT